MSCYLSLEQISYAHHTIFYLSVSELPNVSHDIDVDAPIRCGQEAQESARGIVNERHSRPDDDLQSWLQL